MLLLEIFSLALQMLKYVTLWQLVWDVKCRNAWTQETCLSGVRIFCGAMAGSHQQKHWRDTFYIYRSESKVCMLVWASCELYFGSQNRGSLMQLLNDYLKWSILTCSQHIVNSVSALTLFTFCNLTK